MKKNYFKTGDRVRVIKDGSNASDFTSKLDINLIGVYSLRNWMNIEFTICGQFEPIEFDFSPEIYGAYPLAKGNKIVGFVYNTALELVK